MTPERLLQELLVANSATDVESVLDAWGADQGTWIPVGGRENNRGTVEAAGDPGRSLVERVTNGVDAVLELEHALHNGRPDCRSPREAAQAWLGLPEGGISELSQAERQRLAKRVTVTLLEGTGRDRRVIVVQDSGIGILPERMAGTILSLNEGNKLTKHYLAGLYGQGGSSTFAASQYAIIASRGADGAPVAFTVVKFLDLPPDHYRTGHYVYLTIEGAVLQANLAMSDFARGTTIRHVGYDLSNYSGPLGTNSLYGLFNAVLFDPIVPIWLDSRVHNYRRVIKGARNALNGAVDDGDERRSGPTLAHRGRYFMVGVGDYGRIGLEYWLLEAPTRENKTPSAAFVNPKKPIVLTLNGQNQAELSQSLIRKQAELPYLTTTLIAHVDCNHLTPAAKRALFVSNREDARRGAVYDIIERELVAALKADDDLKRLNAAAKESSLQQHDEAAQRQMQSEVARLLRLHGMSIGASAGTSPSASGNRDVPPGGGGRGPRPVVPIATVEPPTFVRLVADEERPLKFYPGQRRYIRVETDAPSHYHDVRHPERSRINVILTGDGLRLSGTTPLEGGRMRLIVASDPSALVGTEGSIRVELSRQGLPTVSDDHSTVIVERPPARESRSTASVPPFDVREVSGPDDPMWARFSWPDDVEKVASTAEMENGTLVVYYSAAFPKYAHRRAEYERRDPALANSFTAKYRIWLAVHSLMLHADQESTPMASEAGDDESATQQEQQERIRIAVMSSLFAAREIQVGSAAPEGD